MPGFFEKILEKLGLSGSEGSSVLGLDIGSSSIKAVQLRKEKGVAVLETYGEISLGPYVGESVGKAVKVSSENLTEALNDLLKEADITTRDCGMTIPYSSSLISFIKVPNVGENKLNDMIPIEARKYIPVPISEVVLDWFVVPEKAQETEKDSKGKRRSVNVMIVAIHNNILNEYQNIIKNIGLSVSFFEIEIFSVVRAVLDRGTAPVMVMDVGSASTKLYIVEKGVIKYSHSIGKGGQDITIALSRSLNMSIEKAEKTKRVSGLQTEKEKSKVGTHAEVVLNHILSEASKVLLNYQRENQKNITDVVLTGGGVFMEGFIEKAKKQLDANVSLADPFSKVRTPAFLEDALKKTGPEFSAAIGSALRRLEEKV